MDGRGRGGGESGENAEGEGRREDASIYLGRRTALVDGSAGTARSAVLVKASLSQVRFKPSMDVRRPHS